MSTITINGRPIGAGSPPYIVAEISGNHGGSCVEAVELVKAAAKAGADAIKLQTYRPEDMTIDFNGPGFMIGGGLWDGTKLFHLYKEAQTPWEWHQSIFDCAADCGIDAFSTPFSAEAVDFLETLGCPAYKIASFENEDIALIEKAASTGKPIIMSTGMIDDDDLWTSVAAIGDNEFALLHCVSSYPAMYSDLNLHMIRTLEDYYHVPVGFSDHSKGTAGAVGAVIAGACIIEKHITLDKNSVDGAFSLLPDEFAKMVSHAKLAYDMMWRPPERYPEETSRKLKRSLRAVQDIAEGEVLTSTNVRSIRPAGGLPPRYLDRVIGQKAKTALKRGDPIIL